MKRYAAALASLALGVGIIQAGPAEAGDGGFTFNITSIQVEDYAIRSGGCHSIPIVATHDAPTVADFVSADMEVWNGSKYVGEAFLTGDGPGQLEGSFHYCSFKGYGNFRLGPTAINWSGMTADDFLSGEFQSSTTANFVVKMASSVTRPKWSKKGRLATVSAKGSWFSVDDSRWRSDPKGIKSRLQTRANSSKPWRTIKSARSDRKGVVKFKIKPKRTAQYRVLSQEGKDVFGGTSPTITKR